MMWSLYWRYSLALLMVFFITLGCVEQFKIMALLPSSRFNPTAFWGFASVVALLSLLLTRDGLVHAIFGSSLGHGPEFWRKTNNSFIGLFPLLCVAAFLFQGVMPPLWWGYYKLYGQPLVLLLWPLCASRFMIPRD